MCRVASRIDSALPQYAPVALTSPIDVLVMGPFPPPLGGVSTHVKRLATLLAQEGIHVAVLNHFGCNRGQERDSPVIGALHRNPFLYWRAARSVDAGIVHYHEARPATLVAVALARGRSTSRTFVATLHGHPTVRLLGSRVPGVSRLIRWALGRFDELVAVSPEIAKCLRKALPSASISVIPAYLPPDPAEAAGDLPTPIDDMVRRPGTTLVVSAYRLGRPNEQGDLYGINRAIRVFLALAGRFPRLRLAIFLAHPPRGPSSRRYLATLTQQVEDAGLVGRYAVCTGADLVPVFAHDVIYLRPSQIDGDAVSIREAMDRGVPVIASEVVRRPAGTQVLPADDFQGWCAEVERTLRLRQNGLQQPLARHTTEADHFRLLHLYASHLGEDSPLRIFSEAAY